MSETAAALRILVADDESATVMMTRALLQRRGHTVASAADGAAALREVESQPPFDVVLLDLHMPELDGAGALAAIRALPDPALSGAVVVMLTARADPAVETALLDAGADAVMLKPLRWEALAPVLDRCLAEAAGQPAAAAPPLSASDGTSSGAGLAPVERMLADLPTERVRQLLGITRDNLKQQQADIMAAAVCGDHGEVVRLAHKIAGVAGTFGCMGLHHAAAALEQEGERLDVGALQARTAALGPQFDAGQAYLHEIGARR